MVGFVIAAAGMLQGVLIVSTVVCGVISIWQSNRICNDEEERTMMASVVTPKPANGGHFKTGQ